MQDDNLSVFLQDQAIRQRANQRERSDDPVADWALGQVGDDLSYSLAAPSEEARGKVTDKLGPFRGVGDPKCNKFVWDALNAGGRPAGRMDGGRIPVAKDWGDPNAKIPHYHPVNDGPLEPGDVISNGHHVGLYAPLADGSPGTVSAATPDAPGGVALPLGKVLHNGWGFRGNEGRITVWRQD
jgi:hypothetical protein